MATIPKSIMLLVLPLAAAMITSEAEARVALPVTAHRMKRQDYSVDADDEVYAARPVFLPAASRLGQDEATVGQQYYFHPRPSSLSQHLNLLVPMRAWHHQKAKKAAAVVGGEGDEQVDNRQTRDWMTRLG